MKIHSFLIMLALCLTARAGDVLADLQGKWKVDVAATKSTPEGKMALSSKDPLGAAFAKQMFAQFETTVYQFTGDKMITHFKIEGEDGTVEKPFKVIENTQEKLVFEAEGDPGPMYVYRQDKGFVVRDSPKDKPPVSAPPIVLKR